MNSPKKTKACPDRSLRASARGVSLKKYSTQLALLALLVAYPIGAWSQQKPKALKALANKEDVESVARSAKTLKLEEKSRLLERLASPDIKAKATIEDSYIQLLDDGDLDVRGAAARGCAQLKSTRAIPKLRTILKSAPKNRFGSEQNLTDQKAEEYRQSYAVAQALSDLDDFDAAKEILNREMLSMNWETLLPRFGGRILPFLVERGRTSRTNPPPVQDGALRAIAAIQDKDAVPQLKALLSDRDPKIRNSAARSLSLINTPEANAAAEQAYSGLTGWGKLDFVQSGVKRWETAKTLDYAKKFIEDSSNEASSRVQMVQVLGTRKNPATTAYLKALLKNSDDSVRAQAACELAKTTGKLYPYQETNQTRMFEKLCPELRKLRGH